MTNEKKDNVVLYDGAAEEDYVAVIDKAYVANDKYVVTKLDKVSGEVDAYKGDADVRIDNVWYTSTLDDLKGSSARGYEGDFFLYNGYIVKKDAKSGSIADTALVISVGSTFDVDGNYQVKVMINGEPQVVSAEVNDSTIQTTTKNTYCTFEIDDGVYQFKPINDSNEPAGFDYVAVDSYKDKKLYSVANDALIVDADAVFYVQYKTDKYAVVSGSDVVAWGENEKALATSNGTSCVLTEAEGGMTLVKGGYLNLGSASVPTATTTYGVITSSIVTNKDNEKEFTLWNGTEYIDVITSSSASLTKFDLVEYQKNADGTYDIDLKRNATADGVHAIVGWNEASGDINFWKSGNAANDIAKKVVTEDTVVIYVNTDADVDAREAGIQGGKIAISAEPNGVGKGYNTNVMYVSNDTNKSELDVLVIDTMNNVYAQ